MGSDSQRTAFMHGPDELADLEERTVSPVGVHQSEHPSNRDSSESKGARRHFLTRYAMDDWRRNRIAVRTVRRAVGCMCPTPDGRAEGALIARERTLARISHSLAHLAAELSDEEFLRVLRAMLEARVRAKLPAARPPPAE